MIWGYPYFRKPPNGYMIDHRIRNCPVVFSLEIPDNELDAFPWCSCHFRTVNQNFSLFHTKDTCTKVFFWLVFVVWNIYVIFRNVIIPTFPIRRRFFRGLKPPGIGAQFPGSAPLPVTTVAALREALGTLYRKGYCSARGSCRLHWLHCNEML